jgi:hypothetical protein
VQGWLRLTFPEWGLAPTHGGGWPSCYAKVDRLPYSWANESHPGEQLSEFIRACAARLAEALGSASAHRLDGRLRSRPLEVVLAEHHLYSGLAAVDYELLPHADSAPPEFQETVRRYSEGLACDVVALADGAAMVHLDSESHPVGQVRR